jgi:Gpi18-like mannosyltransferase
MTVTEREPVTEEPDGTAERTRIRRGIRYSLLVFLAVRVGLTLVALIGIGIIPHTHTYQPVGVPGWPAPAFGTGPHVIFTSWERFDGLWFLRIAAGGYATGDGSAVFFPLYPLLIRSVSWIFGGHPFAASLFVSNACLAGALVVLYFLTAGELSESAARKAVVYMAVFPTAFFFLAPYSESPFLLLTVASFWGARRGRWWLAGVCGALAAASRSIGILMVPALAIEALHQWRRPEGDAERGPLWPKLAWSASAGLGLLAYLLYWQAKSGDLLAPLHQEHTWERVASTPWHALNDATAFAFRHIGATYSGYYLLDWLVSIPCFLLAIYAFFRFRPAYGFYACASIVVPLCFIFPGRPLLSVPRFLAVLFPIHWGLADLAERRWVPHTLVVASSAALLGIFTVLFVSWYYVF